MADNVAITAGSGTNIAADDIASVWYQRVKISQGADGSATDVSSAAPLNVTLANTGANSTPIVVDLGANNDVTVTGTVTANPSTVASVSHTVAAASDNATSIKASAGTLYQVNVFNVADYPIYVKFHNTASTPTAGSGVVLTVGVQAGVGKEVQFPQGGRAFATGIGMTIVKGIADNSTTAVAASDCVVDVIYA